MRDQSKPFEPYPGNRLHTCNRHQTYFSGNDGCEKCASEKRIQQLVEDLKANPDLTIKLKEIILRTEIAQ